MSDTEQKTPNKTGASGAAWSESEKIAYLIVLCENEGKVDAKIANAPIPAGRSIVSCKKLLQRLKEKHKDDIVKIKAGLALGATPNLGGEDANSTPTKKTKAAGGRKRKTNADEDAATDDSPVKKKAGGRKTNDAATAIKQEMGEEQEDLEDSMEV